VSDSPSSFPCVGGITAYNYYGALVSQSSFSGTVLGKQYTGGIVGYNSQAADHNSRVEDCWSSGIVTGSSKAGGIVGENQVNASIRRCYSSAAVSAATVGGIAGSNDSTLPEALTACAALNSSLTGTGTGVHRIAGSGNNFSGNIAWSAMPLANNNGSLSPTAATAATAAGLDGADCVAKPDQTVFTGMGWDFNTVWKMGGSGYPVLRWQN
jgi:hypothetical protein